MTPAPARASRIDAHREVFIRAATHALCAVAPIFFTVYMIWYSIQHQAFAFDFDHAFWPAGVRVLHGLTPYPSPTSFAATHGLAFVYPAPGALFFVAFAWIPRILADALFTAVCLGATAAALWVLRVRDWRIYGVVFLWGPVLSGWQTANVSLLLALAIAVAWRYRDRPIVLGLLVGLVVSVKLFLWPLAGWLILMRRWRALGVAVAAGLTTTLVGWLVLGFGQLGPYTTLVKAVTRLEELTAYTPLALVLRLGLGRIAAESVTVALIILVSVASVLAARRGKDSTVLLGAIILSLLVTPIVWRHYFVLLLAPLAISRPRFSAAWTIPVVLLIVPVTGPALWQLSLALAAIGGLVFVLFKWPSAVLGLPDARSRSLRGRRTTFWRPGSPSHGEISAG